MFEETVGLRNANPNASRAFERSRESFLALARAGVEIELRTTLTPVLAPYAPRIVEVASDLWREAGVERGARSLIFQQARSDGTSDTFARTLPERPRWNRMFEAVLDSARTTGDVVGVRVEARA